MAQDITTADILKGDHYRDEWQEGEHHPTTPKEDRLEALLCESDDFIHIISEMKSWNIDSDFIIGYLKENITFTDLLESICKYAELYKKVGTFPKLMPDRVISFYEPKRTKEDVHETKKFRQVVVEQFLVR